MTHCEECNKTVDERSLQHIDDRFICLNCEDTVTENLQDQIDELLTFEDFEEYNTGGGCLAHIKYIQFENELHTLVLTDSGGCGRPTADHGILIGLYRGDWLSEWGNDVYEAPIFTETYISRHITEGLERINALLTTNGGKA